MAPRAGEKPMNRTTRRARYALPTAIAALVATGFSAASLAAGCGSGQTDNSMCSLGTEGCPCDSPGVTVDCSETVSYVPGADSAQCRSGRRTCDGGKWGACIGSAQSFQSVPAAIARSATPTPCASNPCDPGCQVFVDTGSDLDAGTGVTTNEAGGISLTVQEAGAVGNWDGGVNDGGTACTTGELKCQIPACAGSGGYLATKISGAVYDPAGNNPIPNVLVYVPNGAVTALTEGVSCDSCTTGSGSPIVSAITDYKGEFTLNGVPAGANIPLVIQSGKWRRQLTIPSVTSCINNTFTTGLNPATAPLIRFPKNRSEGNIPRIAFVSGGADAFECVLKKMGMDVTAATSEIGVPILADGSFNDDRIHYYNSPTHPGNDLSGTLGGGAPNANTLWTDTGSAAGASCNANSDCSSGVCTGATSSAAVLNPSFESGTASWTAVGSVNQFSAPVHAGGNSMRLGRATTADNSLSQTFTAPASPSTLSFWYLSQCWDWVGYANAYATLKDNTAGGAAVTILGATCTGDSTWRQVTAALIAGHSYTLKLATYYDNARTSYWDHAFFDDVTISTSGTCTGSGTRRIDRYDAVILACEGHDDNKGDTVNQAIADYAGRGGRLFATHFSYSYLEHSPATNWPAVAHWNHVSQGDSAVTFYVNQSFPKGGTFASWLQHVGASTTLGELSVIETRRDYDYVDRTLATPWMYANASGSISGATGGGLAGGAVCTSGAECKSGTCSGSGSGTIVNGSFESSISGNWTVSGSKANVSNNEKHGTGTYSMRLGDGDKSTDNSATQTFVAPAGGGTLSFWYWNKCDDIVANDWARATLEDLTAGGIATILAKTCNDAGWQQVTATLIGGHSYKLTLENHDNNHFNSDGSNTYYDEVTVLSTGTCTAYTPCATDANCSGLGAGAKCWDGTCIPPHDMEPLMTFNVPVGAAAASQCGRVVYSDFHVSAAAATSGTFPTACTGTYLSGQEKALEYMLFDLTACLSPDYIPTGGGSPPYAVTMAVTRDYVATCPMGTAPTWHFFDWKTTTPGDTSIEFFAQTASTAAGLSSATQVLLTSPAISGPAVTTWTGVDVAGKLAPIPSQAQLRITMVLHPSSDKTLTPTVDAWRQAYTCVAVE